jgi:N-acetylmuramoyl-L-alanine amidase
MLRMPSPRSPCLRNPRFRAVAVVALTLVAALALELAGALAANASPATRPTSARLATAAPAAALPPAALATSQPVLRTGSRGAAVVTLQRRLVALHYDIGAVDGSFGSQTFHGVVAFQKVNGLTRDGVVGPRTWAALAHPVIPRPRRTFSGISVEVNITRQVLYLARNGAVIRILDASSGKSSTPTPLGNFTIQRRIDGWRQSSLGLLWRPNYFFRGYAVHGSTSVPAYPASHGCVRVTIASMNRLWSVLKIGMPVSLYR